MSLSPGSRLGTYEILASIGAGGMGEVYRARDSKLDRDVAIKVLPESVAADPDALARFEREAKAVAALSHRNILSIFDLGTQDGTTYAVMELLEGETLRGKLDAGQISQKQAVEYALQIARGLTAAHERGIVHRDLKPENVFVLKDGHVKILDFGLAKRLEAAVPSNETNAPTASGHTRPGTVMGTVGYMSPEQVRGLPVDHRSDIFSFGTILFELLTGRKAFKKDTASDTMAAILRDDPPALSGSGRNLSPALDHIVRHCLEKDRDLRFQSARDIAFNLSEQSSSSVSSSAQEAAPAAPKRKALAAAVATLAALLVGAGILLLRRPVAPSGTAVSSIAVLPFVNMSADKDQELFADGISEELLTLLAKIPQLRVIARTSSFSFKGKDVDVATIAKTLNVAHVLEGSIRRSGNRVRINAQLVRTADSSHLWSETYDRSLDDILAVQDEISAAVVAQLKVKLLGAAPKAKAVDSKAYALVVQARQLGRLGTKEGYDQSLALLQQALATEPGYALAWDNVAFYYVVQGNRGWMPRQEAYRMAREAVAKALAADPDLSRAHARLGEIAINEDDPAAAAPHVQHALALAPTNDVSLSTASTLLALLGRFDEALAAGEYLISKDPVNPVVLVNQAETFCEVGRYADAIAMFRTVLSLTPGRPSALREMAKALLLSGKPEEAMAVIREIKSEASRMRFQAMAFHAMEKKDESDATLARLIEKFGQDEKWDIASVYAFRGEADQAFEWLEKASHEPGWSGILNDRLFAKIKKDPRWLPFLRKGGFAPEQLAAIKFEVVVPKAGG